MATRLSDFLAKAAESYDATYLKLPIFHTCTYENTLDYISLGQINCSHCDVWESNMVYMFLGKARFLRQIPKKTVEYHPIAFLFKPSANLPISRIYPFDTGAVKEGIFHPILQVGDIDQVKTKYLLGSNIFYSYSLINFFFKSLTDYLHERSINHDVEQIKELAIVSGATQLQTLNSLYNDIHLQCDGRQKTIEIHSETEILLTDNLIGHIMLPTEIFIKNNDLKKWCENQNVEPVFYADAYPEFSDQYYGSLFTKSVELANEYNI